MSELKAYTYDDMLDGVANVDIEYYPKSEADKVIAELEESHKNEVGQLLIEIAELKNRIAPKQSDKTLQERLNEVCEKHGVSTLQDLDWAFCRAEEKSTALCVDSIGEIARQKRKRCIALAKLCEHKQNSLLYYSDVWDRLEKWKKRWLAIADKFNEA